MTEKASVPLRPRMVGTSDTEPQTASRWNLPLLKYGMNSALLLRDNTTKEEPCLEINGKEA
jgi:hypothetical protein